MHPQRVDELMVDLGTAGGHRVVLLSLEVHARFADLRFARTETPGALALPRRVPHQRDVDITIDGEQATVVDVVGRGDRSFSNGEIRIQPPPSPGAVLAVAILLAPGDDPLVATVHLSSRA